MRISQTYAGVYRLYVVDADYDARDEKRVKLSGEFPDGSEYEMTEFLFRGKQNEIIEYLNAPERLQELYERILVIDGKIEKRGGNYRD